MTRVYPPYVALTRDQIVAIVEEVLVSYGEVPMDTAITTALYPGREGAPKRWADWHEEAKSIHLEALEYFTERRRSFLVEPVLVQPDEVRAARRRHRITAAQGWDVLSASMQAAPHLRLTWPDIARRLGVQPRAAEHLIKSRLGIRFSGRRGETRAITKGPCVECGKLYDFKELSSGFRGPCCPEKRVA